MPVPEELTRNCKVPSPVMLLTATVIVVPLTLIAETVPDTLPVFSSEKLLAFTPVTLSLKVTLNCALLALVCWSPTRVMPVTVGAVASGTEEEKPYILLTVAMVSDRIRSIDGEIGLLAVKVAAATAALMSAAVPISWMPTKPESASVKPLMTPKLGTSVSVSGSGPSASDTVKSAKAAATPTVTAVALSGTPVITGSSLVAATVTVRVATALSSAPSLTEKLMVRSAVLGVSEELV